MNTLPKLTRPPAPFDPIAAAGRGGERFRTPGPVCWSRDPYVIHHRSLLREAWELARQRYVELAIERQTSGDFLARIRNLLGGLLMSLDLEREASAGRVSALGVGACGLPGTMVGAGVGHRLSLQLLEGLEAEFLLPELTPYLGVVDRAFRRGVTEAWESAGSPLRIEAAALMMADALGVFFSMVLQGLIASFAKELGGKAKGRVRLALAERQEARLFRGSAGLDVWLQSNYGRLLERFKAESSDEGPSTSNVSTSGILAPRIPPSVSLPDISQDFQFREYVSDGKTYKEGRGQLGVPGRVRTHRSTAAQREVSEGTGDDAGHLIGNRFGAPGGPENLSAQNWVANRYGSFKGLEDSWADALMDGSEIEVVVTDVTRPEEDRPFMRQVRWTEVKPDGRRLAESLTFANMHTPKSREARKIAPTVEPGQMGRLIEVDFTKKSE